jgi:hypothetical protein
MTSRFRLLAQVSLRHDYYAEGVCADFSVRPSRSTAGALEASGLMWKARPDGFLLAVRVDETGHPAVPLPSDARWVFHLTLDDPAFMVTTNLDEESLRSRRFHFTNLAANVVGPAAARVLNLTRPLGLHDMARTYLPGELARVGVNVHECLTKALGQSPTASNTTFWVNRGEIHYASRSDLVPFRAQRSMFTVTTPAVAFRVRVFGRDNQLLRDGVITPSATEPGREVPVDLTAMPAGRYLLDINGEVFEAWFDDEALARSAFGVIELHNHLPTSDAYSLLDAGNVVRQLEYVVRFANRRAFWKYLTPLHKVSDIRPSADHNAASPFTAGSNNPAQPNVKDFFISKRPLPLTERAGDASFDLILTGADRRAPRPDPRLPGLLTRTFDSAAQAYTDSICTMRLNH